MRATGKFMDGNPQNTDKVKLKRGKQKERELSKRIQSTKNKKQETKMKSTDPRNSGEATYEYIESRGDYKER